MFTNCDKMFPTFEYAIALTNRWSASTTEDMAFSRNSPYMLRILGCRGHSASACLYSLEARSALLLLAAACTDFIASASHSDHDDALSSSCERCSSNCVDPRLNGLCLRAIYIVSWPLKFDPNPILMGRGLYHAFLEDPIR